MIRFLLGLASNLVLAAVALIVASLVVDGVHLQLGGFLVAVGVLALAQAILAPFVFNLARRYASAVLGGIGIVSTFLALWIATLFRGGITIDGVTAWIAAPIIVWVVTALGGWVIMGVIVERWLKRREEDRLLERREAKRR